jgi:hypothetical protein
VVLSVSASTVRRWLATDAIKPWQHRSWIFPRDPDFAVKAGRVLDLYARTFDGEPLDADDYVLSADEKPSVQARARTHPSCPPRPGRRPLRVETEYRRYGTLAYLAAYDVHHAQVIGHSAPTTGIAPFTDLVTKVMAREPYARARRVFWIVDNGTSHRGWTAAARLSDAFPNAIMVHTPIHASWLNQIEIYFSIIQRKLLTPDNVASLEALAEQLAACETRYNQLARPFDWRFNRDDLKRLLGRIGALTPDELKGASTSAAASPAVEQTAIRKVATRLVPFVALMFFINFLDRTAIGFAAPNGMEEDLALTATQFGFASGVFFIGYILLEVPSNIALHKVGARRWLARIMVKWGIVALLFTWVQSATQLYILRFLLGVAEAGFFPELFCS